jgi:hypothetical protein
MPEPLMDFRCYIGKYEFKRFDELDKNQQEYIESANMPHLVQVGPGRLVKPSRKALHYAVGLLLQTKMPKWWAANGFASDDEHARALHQQLIISDEEDDDFDPEELSLLKRNVLAITRHIGMLTGGGPDPQTNPSFEDFEGDEESYVFYHEPLRTWIWLAAWLQRIFALRDENTNFDVVVGPLSVFLSNRPGKPISMQVRPENTLDALLYVVAGMIVGGTEVQTCDNCRKPFLEGGKRGGRNKKRAGSRFCSNKCRYEYHNEARRKARATKTVRKRT